MQHLQALPEDDQALRAPVGGRPGADGPVRWVDEEGGEGVTGRVPCPAQGCSKTVPANPHAMRTHFMTDHPGLGQREMSLLIDKALNRWSRGSGIVLSGREGER